ncbi:efflux RND transporter periplasmic adaptor subunit [Flavobacteriaceae bacterium]|jgi:HlyD family secretion protein|nr:efflux RND transporter periplasmic adaptor subunit [bacterium]MDA9310308.1 efflux RND transporter periplasmic adaptor subunit [Flavobacteriaceae bacterium]MDC0097727.1 efflux RND transporter periplasmic adaptor subunit [Flavobacteriaceae bacterium]MDC1373108.1 efflux RND transporter periplasmic adaptor subunit [Flavobacteriaceae bacterium]
MKKKTLFWILGIVIVTLVVLVGGKKAGMFGKTKRGKEVEIAKITPIDIIETVAATGKIQPEVEVALSSEVSGEIISLPIKEGQEIKKGELLVKINPDLIQAAVSQSQAGLQNIKAQLAQAEASARNAKANYQRNKTLYDKGVISKLDWDRSIAEYEGAQANVESAFYSVKSAAASLKQSRDNLSRTAIYAPMSGTISRLAVELGERVVGTAQMAGTEIVRVADLTNMEVEVDVNENDIVKVNVGDKTIVEVDAYLKREFRGEVTEIANSALTALSADQVTNFKVKVRILPESYSDLTQGKPESYSPFRPGMTATVDIITNKRTQIIGVPISAVVIKTDTTCTKEKINKKKITSEKQEKYEVVFVKNGEKAALRVIKTGIQDDSNIEVLSGLLAGDEVITGPYNTVTKSLKCDDLIDLKQEEEQED